MDGTTGQNLAGSASQEAPFQLSIAIQCAEDRPDNDAHIKRVGDALSVAIQDCPDLAKAFGQLAANTTFGIVIGSNQKRRIILPASMGVRP